MSHKSSTTGVKTGRREFLAGSTVAAATMMSPSLVRGSEANSTIRLGMIGCGGRGSWIANLFNKHGNYKFVACADYFQDKVDAFGKKYEVPENRRYTTLSCYKKMMDDKDVDAVVIESPPYAHPEQAAAAVEAGKHVFLAKPIAVDVPGCRSVEESGKKATEKKLVYLIDFQTRANKVFQEAVKRVHKGEIGELMCGNGNYFCEWDPTRPIKTPEDRVRHWYALLSMSGDFLVEQNIHSIDVATWLIDAHPVQAFGRGGRQKRENGNIWDHFHLIYDFPNNMSLGYTGIQAVPGIPDVIRCRLFGTKGLVDTDYFGKVFIAGDNPYKGAEMKNLYTDGAVNNIKDFEKFIRKGESSNTTVPPSVRSNLTAILGREAAYRRDVLTWEQMMKENKKIPYKTDGLKT
jgi:predicted dehydrogenase